MKSSFSINEEAVRSYSLDYFLIAACCRQESLKWLEKTLIREALLAKKILLSNNIIQDKDPALAKIYKLHDEILIAYQRMTVPVVSPWSRRIKFAGIAAGMIATGGGLALGLGAWSLLASIPLGFATSAITHHCRNTNKEKRNLTEKMQKQYCKNLGVHAQLQPYRIVIKNRKLAANISLQKRFYQILNLQWEQDSVKEQTHKLRNRLATFKVKYPTPAENSFQYNFHSSAVIYQQITKPKKPKAFTPNDAKEEKKDLAYQSTYSRVSFKLDTELSSKGVLITEDKGSKSYFEAGSELKEIFSLARLENGIIENGFLAAKGFGGLKYLPNLKLYELKKANGLRVFFKKSPKEKNLQIADSTGEIHSIPHWCLIAQGNK